MEIKEKKLWYDDKWEKGFDIGFDSWWKVYGEEIKNNLKNNFKALIRTQIYLASKKDKNNGI
jgi:hypothetical protein